MRTFVTPQTFNISLGKRAGKLKGSLSAAFKKVSPILGKTAIKSSVKFGVKAVAVGAATTIGAPSAIGLGFGAISAATASAYIDYVLECREARRNGEDKPKFFTKVRAKSSALSTVFGVFGASVFSEDVRSAFSSVAENFKIPNPINIIIPRAFAQQAPIADVVPETQSNPAELEKLRSSALGEIEENPVGSNEEVNSEVPVAEASSQEMGQLALEALARANAGDAQGMKDFAYHLLNGDGVEQDITRAADLYEQAAALGNVQALRDIEILKSMDKYKDVFNAGEVGIPLLDFNPIMPSFEEGLTESDKLNLAQLETMKSAVEQPVIVAENVIGQCNVEVGEVTESEGGWTAATSYDCSFNGESDIKYGQVIHVNFNDQVIPVNYEPAHGFDMNVGAFVDRNVLPIFAQLAVEDAHPTEAIKYANSNIKTLVSP